PDGPPPAPRDDAPHPRGSDRARPSESLQRRHVLGARALPPSLGGTPAATAGLARFGFPARADPAGLGARDRRTPALARARMDGRGALRRSRDPLRQSDGGAPAGRLRAAVLEGDPAPVPRH